MTIHDRQRELEAITPEVPEDFHQAMCRTLGGIVAREQNAQAYPDHTATVRGRAHRGRTLAFVLIAALLLATVAFAAYRWQLFDALRFMTGPTPTTADGIMHSGLGQTTVNGVTITVDEAGYDGRTLFIRYTYHMPDVDTPLGAYRDGGSGEGVSDADMQLLFDRNVGWWIDHLWINGQCVDMPANSGNVMSGSPTPGELVETEYWRLDNVDMQLSGKVEIALPIGERQSTDDYMLQKHPERYDSNGLMKLPEKGMVSFTLDTTGMLAKVRTAAPNVPVTTPYGTAAVTEAAFTPLMSYITLSLDADPDVVAAYQQEYGRGFYGEDGTLLFEYGGADVFNDWIYALTLVDGDGKALFPDTDNFGLNGYGNEWAEFTYPYIEKLPDALYLAPVTDGVAEMAYAVKVK
ncbi:MAG: DUF4179 domain-containing protein [Candidatus Limiplasma sp.]|nr:DUF4179 domain-containing protein [Candidatus Limiplasma sp.]